MKSNLHLWDRGFRIVLGTILISMTFFSPGDFWYFVGILPLLTGAVGLCPVYKMFNFTTKKA